MRWFLAGSHSEPPARCRSPFCVRRPPSSSPGEPVASACARPQDASLPPALCSAHPRPRALVARDLLCSPGRPPASSLYRSGGAGVVQGRGRAEGDYEGGEVGGDEHSRRAHDLLPYPPPAPLHLHVPVLGQTLCHHLLLVLCAATGRGGCRRRLLELELCVDRIRELRAELEFERWMRRKAEALVMELVEERRRGEAECRALREEAAAARAKVEEAEEERRMLCVAELWHEERVQMKLVDARAAMEKLRGGPRRGCELHAVAGGRSSSNPVGKSWPRRSQ
jgi:hypothetical protein